MRQPVRSNRRQPFAANPAAVAEDGLAAPARIAAQKPVLPFSPDFRWLILSFHKSVQSSRPVSSCPRDDFARKTPEIEARQITSENPPVNRTRLLFFPHSPLK